MPRKKQVDRIVRVALSDNRTMLFGNSYKPWEMQFEEYLFLLKRKDSLTPNTVKDIRIADEPWIGWGGLKWCPEGKFQEQLNREGCQSDDPDNENPRQYTAMAFYYDRDVHQYAQKKVKDLVANNY